MALKTTPEALVELGRLHARIAELERLYGIRAPGLPDGPSEAPPAYAEGLHEIVAGFVDEMVVVCDIAGTVLFANHATERVLGYRPHEMVGTNAWSYVHPEDLKATATARSAPLDDGIPFENRARAADGAYRWLEFVARRWPQENPTHVVLRFRRAMHREPVPDPDVSFTPSRLQIQLRYAAALARLSQLALGLPLVSDVLDAGTSLGATGLGLEFGAWLEPAGDALRVRTETGLGPAARGLEVPVTRSVAGLAWARRVPADETQLEREHRAADPLLAAAGAASALAVPVRGVDRVHGVLVLAAKAARAFEPEDVHFAETVGNVIATALDSRAAQEALTSRERLTRAVFDHARDGLAIVDDEGRCVDANDAAHAALCVPHGSLRGRRPADVAATSLDLSREARLASPSGETAVRGPDGSLHTVEYELISRILPGVALAILRDVTERRDLQARLALADRLVAVGTLAAGVAHELNTPLSYVSANLQYLYDLLPRLVPPGDERGRHARDAVSESLEGTGRLRTIIDDLRAFVRTSGEADTSADLGAVIRASVAMTWNDIRHRAQLVRLVEPLPPVAGNPARLVQVFVNLLINAAQAIPLGAAAENRIRISARRKRDGLVEIEVADTGPGIPAEIRDRIFDPFFTTKAHGAGTGLGLSICRSILAAVGGTIELDGEPGHGTVARVTLPTRPAAAGEAAAPAPAAAPPRRGRILFVDDDQLLAASLRRALGDEHDVTTVGSPWLALRLVERRERFDAVLSDQLMPEMLGIDLQRALADADPRLKGRILLMSGGAFSDEERRQVEEGSIRFLQKPLDVAELRKALAEVLARPDAAPPGP